MRIAQDHDPALCRIAHDHDPALCRIAQDQNGIELDQKVKNFTAMLYCLKEQSIK
jgi:hypothetical protein